MTWWSDFKTDAARWVNEPEIGDPDLVSVGQLARLCVRHVPLRAMFWLRLGQGAKRRRIRGVTSWCQRRLLYKYGLDVVVGRPMGGGLYIPHPSGTVIAARSIGDHCSVIAAVTVGMIGPEEFPTLGDRVYLGAGCRVLGAIHVGDDAKVGANAVVLGDVEPGATVVGMPAKPVS